MPLTAVIGSSGSGKTTFLNDVQKSHKGIYIRQYHNMRPYIVVTQIPNFNPTKLPFWDIYERESNAMTVRVGGTMAGEFTAGLSGGQRKLLLFELICQRVRSQRDLLIILDEPFAGVTDDFVPFVIERLEEMRSNHNVLLVTNDHVKAITKMSDNTIRVSAVDRSMVTFNKQSQSRASTIEALSVGDRFVSDSSSQDLHFFLQTEVLTNRPLSYSILFTIVAFCLFILALWGSDPSNIALVIIGAEMTAFEAIYAYVLTFVDWRNAMTEETEALLHSSKGMNKILKILVTIFFIMILSTIEYASINVVVSGFSDIRYLVALICDNMYSSYAFLSFGLFSNAPFTAVATCSSSIYLFMVFFSTASSPGSGLPGIKALRYIFPRFYFWCMLPEIGEEMEGCPADDRTLIYLLLSACVGPCIFAIVRLVCAIKKWRVKNSIADKTPKLAV